VQQLSLSTVCGPCAVVYTESTSRLLGRHASAPYNAGAAAAIALALHIPQDSLSMLTLLLPISMHALLMLTVSTGEMVEGLCLKLYARPA
jgi:hypothetical protein